jgi:hypothetical protein
MGTRGREVAALVKSNHHFPRVCPRGSHFLSLLLLPTLVILSGCQDEASEAGESEPGIEITTQETPTAPRQAPPRPVEKEEQTALAPNPEDTTFAPPSEDPAQERLDYLQDQIEQNEAQLRAERDRFEQERRQRAIDDYEAALSHYISEIQRLTEGIESMKTSRDVAYSDFEREFGVPFVRFNTDCGNATDFFRCINASAAMPTFEFSIRQAETNIGIYNRAIDALIYPY